MIYYSTHPNAAVLLFPTAPRDEEIVWLGGEDNLELVSSKADPAKLLLYS
jgi:hypothetical protein